MSVEESEKKRREIILDVKNKIKKNRREKS